MEFFRYDIAEKNSEKLDDKVSAVSCVNGRVYFVKYEDNVPMLYSSDSRGGDKKLITKDCYVNYCIAGDSIYYQNYASMNKTMHVCNIDGSDDREILGYLPQDTGFYPNFSGYELMNYFSMLKDVKAPQKRIKELLEFVNLTDDAKRKYKEYSGGMKRRLGIAVSMLNDPKILILDVNCSILFAVYSGYGNNA